MFGVRDRTRCWLKGPSLKTDVPSPCAPLVHPARFRGGGGGVTSQRSQTCHNRWPQSLISSLSDGLKNFLLLPQKHFLRFPRRRFSRHFLQANNYVTLEIQSRKQHPPVCTSNNGWMCPFPTFPHVFMGCGANEGYLLNHPLLPMGFVQLAVLKASGKSQLWFIYGRTGGASSLPRKSHGRW